DSHVGVLSFPFGTHAAPLVALVRRLAAAAPTVRFSFFNGSTSNRNIDIVAVAEAHANVKGYDVWDGTPEGFSGTHFEEVGLFLKASPGNFQKALEVAEAQVGLPVSCFIADAFLWFTGELAEKRGVPWLAFWAAASCSLAAHVYTHEIVAAAKDRSPRGKLTSIPGLETADFDDLPPEIFLEENPTPLAVTIDKMVKHLPSSAALVLNSFEEIDPTITADLKTKFRHFLNIGPSILASPPLPPPDKSGCLRWLDAQTTSSVIYISFGTVIVPPEHELSALAAALEASHLPFLWSLSDRAKKTLPEEFLRRTAETGKIVPWAPQLQILSHRSVAAFVTHCGWNSIVESICGGVPLICRPFFGDQKVNGRMVQDSWKIGVIVDGGVFTETATLGALKTVTNSKDGKKMRENAIKLKQHAVDATKPQGTSTHNFHKLLQLI
ncbi:hypothetical protein M569_11313, partial [Genlisea aurea]